MPSNLSCDQKCPSPHREVSLHREFFFPIWGTCTIFLLLKGILITHPFSSSVILLSLGSSRAEGTLTVGSTAFGAGRLRRFVRGVSQSEWTLGRQLGGQSSAHSRAGSAELSFSSRLHFQQLFAHTCFARRFLHRSSGSRTCKPAPRLSSHQSQTACTEIEVNTTVSFAKLAQGFGYWCDGIRKFPEESFSKKGFLSIN